MSTIRIHKVKTICFELDTDTEDQAHRCAEIARNMNMRSILDKALRSYDDKKEYIRIDRLVIDLGTIDELDYECSGEIISQIRLQVNQQLQAVRTQNTFSQEIGLESEGKKTKLIYTENYKLELLIHYLQTGVLPWYVDEVMDVDELLQEIIADGQPGLLLLLSGVFKKHIVRKRLVQVFKEKSLHDLFSLFTGSGPWPELRQVLIILNKIIPVQDREQLTTELHGWVIEAISYGFLEVEKVVSFILRKLEKKMLAIPVKELEQLPAAFQLEFSSTGLIGEGCFTLVMDFLKSKASISDIEKTQEKTVPVAIEDEANMVSDETSPIQMQDLDGQIKTGDDIIFIGNAGLVLINAALIRQWLEKQGWISHAEFISVKSRNKAMQWLQYLITGETEIHEYQLALNKIICGMEPSDIARIEGELSIDEKNEAGLLLETIIENWAALKNTSTGNLQQSFLQRKGRLKQEEGAWHLHVESKPFDILVERIPWTFSIIKFPWMTKPIFTQWLTRI